MLLVVLLLTTMRFVLLGQPLSTHQDREGVPPTVDFVDLPDLYRVVHQVVVDDHRPDLPKQGARVVPHGREMQHLSRVEVRSQRLDWVFSSDIQTSQYLLIHGEELVPAVEVRRCRVGRLWDFAL